MMRAALDANLALAVDARRFLCAMQEMSGGATLLTSRAFREVRGACASTCRRASVKFVRRQRESGRSVDPEKAAFAHVHSYQAWLDAERGRKDSAWTFVPSPPGSQRLQVALLGTDALTDNAKRHDDALVVAEAVLAGAHVLASDNLGSIRHGLLNEWLFEERANGNPLLRKVHETRSFIMVPDDFVLSVAKRLGMEFGRASLRWAVSACRPEAPTPWPEVEKIVRNFAENMSSNGLIGAEWAIKRTLGEMSPREKMALFANQPLAQRTRRSEDRRIGLLSASLAKI